jgi:protocatechuate 3,4-dioxygenase beta subunit
MIGQARTRASLLPLAGLAAALCVLLVPRAGSAAPLECPDSNPPNMLTVVAGSPQTAQLERPFQTNLQVALANSNGCPLTGRLGGISVDFSAPGSGASGTFVGSGSNRVTVGTESTGVATAPTFTANDVAGSYSVHADSDYGDVELSLANTANGVPATIVAVGLTDQAAAVNSQFGQPLQAKVLDANGRPVQGATITFSLGTGASGAGASFVGGGAQDTQTTRANGQATSPPLVANGSPGRFTATASSSGVAGVATYTLANHAAEATISTLADSARTARVETRYRQPLRARVLDASGQPIEGASVTFTLTAAASGAGASFLGGENEATRPTDATGRAASPPFIANKTAGRFSATANTAGSASPATYRLRNLAGAPATITAGAASGQSAPVGARFPIRLAVTVTDANDNPVAGAVTTFIAPARGPSGRFARTRRTVRIASDANGVAIAPAFTANRKPGGYIVTATTGGRRAAFALVNRPRR